MLINVRMWIGRLSSLLRPPQARSCAVDLARTALPTRVLPSFHTAPVVRYAPAMTASNDRSIHSQSSSEIISEGNSLIVWLPCPATCVSNLWSLNNGMTISWQNSPLLAVSSKFQDALSSRGARRPKFNADHQPFAANRSDQLVAAGHLLKRAQQTLAELRRPFDQPLRFDHLQCGKSGRHGEIVL